MLSSKQPQSNLANVTVVAVDNIRQGIAHIKQSNANCVRRWAILHRLAGVDHLVRQVGAINKHILTKLRKLLKRMRRMTKTITLV